MLVMVVTTVISISAAVFNEIKAYYSVNEKEYYTVTLEHGEKIRCYVITDKEHPADKKVSVAWLWTEDGSNPVPASLEIPDTVKLQGVDYTVASVFKGGFRSCTFSEIILPDTIEEIREEAFAYCMNITTFTIPYKVSVIAPSTFMDCQNLEYFYYTGPEDISNPDSKIIKKLGNTTITEIGDHAFDNCKSLKGLYFPTRLVTIGNSAFQRCELLQSLFFPGENAGKSNKIRVGDYAFADCPLLKTVYFEENLEYFGAFCFVNDKEDLTFTYTGTSEPTGYHEDWRDKNITTSNNNKYPFQPFGQSKVHIDEEYPGLIYTYETADQYLDCAGPNPGEDTIKVIENPPEYVKISGFQEPFVPLAGYYDTGSKTFTVPDYVHGRPVKSIGQNAFAGQPFRSVIFNSNLVQIQNRAFYGCSDIASLNFDACTNLIEISYEIFQSTCPELFSEKDPTQYTNKQKYNDKLHSIKLPNCLEFIGDSAFYNFIALTEGITFKGTDPDAPSKLKIIGDFAFSVHRTKNVTFTQDQLIDIELPNSLDDRWATGYHKNGVDIPQAKFYHPYNPYDGKKRVRRCAIGRFAFENQDIIGTLKMEPATQEQMEDMDYTTSFASNTVVRCNNIAKFETNYNVYLIGSDMFKYTPSIKEIFFHTEKAQYQYEENGGAAFPWGIRDDCPFPGDAQTKQKYENGIFSGVKDDDNTNWGNKHTRPDLVIYVSGSKAPGLLDVASAYRSGIYVWNRDASLTYRTELDAGTGNGVISNRKMIPTFYEANWDGPNKNIHYWKPGPNGGTFRDFTDTNYTLNKDEYGEGYISIVNTADKTGYQIAKYFTDGATGHYQEEIDLTSINDETHGNISAKLYGIAGSAFATASTRIPGLYFILPNTIKTIGERAFFRKGGTDGNNAVRIVTTKVNNVIQVPSNESRTYEQIKTAANTDKCGYCILPDAVTTVEENSFFNNAFKTIVINPNITRLGASAFTSYQYDNKVTKIEFSGASGSKFSVANDGFYYTETAAKKTLVYQAAGTTSAELTIADGTKAVGFRAAIGSKYKTITIPEGLTTFYGGAFFNSKMKKIDGHLQSIKYICARTLSGDTEIYDKYNGTYPFDNYDVTPVTGWAVNNNTYIDNARNGAFKNCTNLEEIDFTKMTNLKAIGLEAFSGDKKLKILSPKTYNIYDYTSKTSGQSVDVVNNKVVLDLSNCGALRKIQSKAFTNTELINVAILPTTVGKSTTAESLLKLDDDGGVLPPNSIHLIGETYHQAGINYKDNDLNPRSHYGASAIGATEKNYWRFYVGDDLPSGASVEDYLASTGQESLYEDERYWTIYDGNYYLFKGYSQAKAFYTAVANETYTNPGQALTY